MKEITKQETLDRSAKLLDDWLDTVSNEEFLKVHDEILAGAIRFGKQAPLISEHLNQPLVKEYLNEKEL